MKRVCLLTGSSGLLGQFFCHLYRAEYEIVAVYRNNRPWLPAQDARLMDPTHPARPQTENDHPVFVLRSDLFDRAAPRRIVETVLARYGRLDVIVNAAAATVWAPVTGSTRLADSAAGQFHLAAEVPMRLAAAAAELCWQADTAANREHNRNIVNVSSIAALRTYRGAGQSAYAASKAAMNTLTAHLADEFAPMGVRVNATAANSFPKIVPVQRAAAAIRALDQGRQTGTVVVVDRDEDRQVALAELERAVHAAIEGQRPAVVWFTGVPAAGKSTIAAEVQSRLRAAGLRSVVLDGDDVRHGLNRDLGFSDQDRAENIRRAAQVARLMVDAGLIVLAAFISPFSRDRDAARALFGPGEFCEVFVDTPVEIAEARDPKGLYRKARTGLLPDFTGVSSPYEQPGKPEVRIDTTSTTPPEAADLVMGTLERMGIF